VAKDENDLVFVLLFKERKNLKFFKKSILSFRKLVLIKDFNVGEGDRTAKDRKIHDGVQDVQLPLSLQ
jgi:hypothetical protein